VYVVIATKPVHRLQIRPIVHNYRAPPSIPPSYIRVRAAVWECGEGQTDRHTDIQTAVATIHFASRLCLTRHVIMSSVYVCILPRRVTVTSVLASRTESEKSRSVKLVPSDRPETNVKRCSAAAGDMPM